MKNSITEMKNDINSNAYDKVVFGRIQSLDIRSYSGEIEENYTCDTTKFTFGLDQLDKLSKGFLNSRLVLVLNKKNEAMIVELYENEFGIK